MNVLLLVFAFLSAAGAASASPMTCWIESGGCKVYVGKRLWVYIPPNNPNVIEVTFARGDWTTARTLKLKTGASFVVTGLDKTSYGSDDYQIFTKFMTNAIADRQGIP